MPHLKTATLGAVFLATVPAHATLTQRFARPLAAVLAGRCAAPASVDPDGRGTAPAYGDPDGCCAAPAPGDSDVRGTARITLDLTNGELCFELEVSGISPATAAWIHESRTGRGVITLMPPVGGRSGGCVLAERSALRALQKEPARFYVAIRNADCPGDALRGQLSP